MRILLIGGTAFFGKILTSQLLDAGHELTLLTRGNKKPDVFWSRISHIQCDRTNPTEFKKTISSHEYDVVIDNIAFGQADIESVVDVFAARQNPPQYIFCSSVAVYSESMESKEVLLEDAATLEPAIGDDWEITYANGKRAAEQYLMKNHGDMPYTILRPTVIEGPGDPSRRTWFWIQRICDGSPILLSTKDSRTLYRHVSSVDVAQAFFLTVGNKIAHNKTYNVAGRDILTIKEYIVHIARATGLTEITLCEVAEEDLSLAMKEYMLPPFFGEVSFITSIERIEEELGFRTQETSEWISQTVDSFLEGKNPLSRL